MNKKFLKFLCSILTSFILITNVHALNIVDANETIVQEGEYDSTRLVLGNRVTNKANVNGLSFAAGNDVSLQGNVNYGFYAGNIITINEFIDKDLFLAGNSIKIGKDASLGRDVFIAGNSVSIESNITRDLRVGASSVDLRGITIGGDAYIAAEEIILDADTIISGKLSYYEKAKVEGLDKASVGAVKILKNNEVVTSVSIEKRIMRFLESILAALIVMLVLFFLRPNTKEKLNELELNFGNICRTAGTGVIVLILVPIILVLVILSGILTPLGIITGLIYGISIYLASLVVYYIIGNLICTKLFNNNSVYLTLFIGIVLVKLIKLIPYLGGIVSALVLFFGLGLIYKYIKLK